MNVVVSAIVDPWVTTLSFVVALAMRIQGSKNDPFLCEVVKNAFSWGMQDWQTSMQAIYQRF